MPIFDYKCSKCNNIEEHFVKHFDTLVICSYCDLDMDKLLSSKISFNLKGTGFYKPGFNSHE